MALPTNFTDLPVEVGLDLLKYFSNDELLAILGAYPSVYLKYRDFIPELIQKPNHITYIALYTDFNRSLTAESVPEIKKCAVVVLAVGYLTCTSVEVIGTFDSIDRAIKESIAVLKSRGKTVNISSESENFLYELANIGIRIVKVDLTNKFPPDVLGPIGISDWFIDWAIED